MRIEEARKIAGWIAALDLPPGTVCLNVGSSTADFRKKTQPHIHNCLFAPLERAGLMVVHCDMKEAEGVDEVGDLLDPAFRSRLKAYEARVMICSNLLEHLLDPHGFATACSELVIPGGYGLISVPFDYPYHPDPIDTMLRPSPDELAAMFPGWAVERKEILTSGTHLDDLRSSARPWSVLLRQIGRVSMPFYRPTQWRHIAHRLLWLGKSYKISLVQLKKPVAPD